MDNGDLYSEDVSKLWSVSTKFAYQMKDINFSRSFLTATVSFNENLRFLLDQPNLGLCGSIGEGILYPLQIVQNRDMDLITIYPKTIAVENAHEKHQHDRETFVYLVERENCRPGYCKLRLLNEGTLPLLSLLHDKELNGMNYIHSSWSRHLTGLILCNDDIATQYFCSYPDVTVGRMDERGPAYSKEYSGIEIQSISSSCGLNLTKIDHVCAISHPIWPSCALEWRDRIRPYGWPSQQQIRNIMTKGIFLVPVGSKQSEFEDIEWRYSFNEAERVLVRSFNLTQVKCYVLLKMLVSENVTPRFEDDVISSYHIKTLMFWAIEQTDPQLWVSLNLVELLFRILNVLSQCVANLSCPSYFIPDENIFVGKVTLANRDLVSQVLSDMIRDGWVALTRLKHFATDDNFIRSLYQDNDIVYLEEDEVQQSIDYNRFVDLSSSINIIQSILQLLNVVQSCNITEVNKMDINFKEVINNLLLKIHISDDIRDKEILQNILALIICSYGTHFLSLSRCPSAEITDKCIMEQLGVVYDNLSCKSNLVECIAKHANYTYITGDFQSTIEAAEQLLNRYAHFPLHLPGVTSNIRALCNCSEQEVLMAVINGRNFDELFDNLCFVRCIMFLKNEMYALPADSRVEMFSVLGAGNQLKTMCRNWFGLCPYLYVAYLAFLVNFDLGRTYLVEGYLRLMEFMCRKPSSAYESSSLNLLGACYIKMRQPEKALETFCISMKRQRGKNAVIWHVARLLWRKLQDRWMKNSRSIVK
ncbi:hypothetical protein ACJMK2_027095 [Sinanodonta woodiana]|uniref:Mab-21-like HhH/H2TH-like domain-containing protein n=1 Tax=Sinanodonta woodiana TaxID=1069815 RepID=A0ABD3XM30_SINWO